MANNKWYRVFRDKKNPYLKKSLNVLRKKGSKNHKNISYELSKVVWGSNKFFFLEFINFITKKINFLIKKRKFNIGEYGSGNGFILYYFSKKYKLSNIFSFDISKDYLSFQKKLIGFGKFISVKPENYKIKIKDSSVDIFVISSLFQYLLSYTQAKRLIEECIRVSTYRILILDVYNDLTKKKYNLKKMKESELNQTQFERKYKNLPYRFYRKKFFNYINNNKKVKNFFLQKCQKLGSIDNIAFAL